MSIENTVRTIFTEELAAHSCNIRPETLISEGLIGPKALNRIATRLRTIFDLPVDRLDWTTWTTVGCAIEAVERHVEQKDRAA